LYHGSKEKTNVLIPQPLLESEKNRFTADTGDVVFATVYRKDVLIFMQLPQEKITYLPEISPDGFNINTVG